MTGLDGEADAVHRPHMADHMLGDTGLDGIMLDQIDNVKHGFLPYR